MTTATGTEVSTTVPQTWILVQFGLGRVPLGSSFLGSLLSPSELLFKPLVQITQFTGPHDCGVALKHKGL